MGLDLTPVLLPFGIFLLCYFGTAWLARHNLIPEKLYQHPVTHGLTLLTVTGVITYLGMVEMAGRYGMSALLAFMGFVVIFVFSPLILMPMQWVATTHRFPSLADILVYRFRGHLAGKVFTLTLLITTLPLGMAQLKAVMGGLSYYLSATDSLVTRMATGAPFTLAVGYFLLRHGIGKSSRKKLTLALAAGVLLTLAALVITTVVVVHTVFGGYSGMDNWATATGQTETIQRFGLGYALMAAFLTASMAMPQLFYLQSKIHFSPKKIAYSSWFFPLLLLLVTLPMFPLLWAGLSERVDAPLQLYLLALPRVLELPWISPLVLTGVLAAAGGALMVLTLSISQMLLNYLILPGETSYRGSELYSWLDRKSRICAASLLLLTLVASCLVHSDSITDLTLVALVGLVQLSPGLLAAFYFPAINRTGVLTGLAGGLLVWFAGLMLPLFTGEYLLSLPAFDMLIPFGTSNWHNWLYEAIVVNITLCLLVSHFTNTSEEEARYARECMVDILPVPQRVELAQHSLPEICRRLSTLLGEQTATHEIQKTLKQLQLSDDETRPYALRLIRDQLSANLCALLGYLTAQQIIDNAVPLSSSPEMGAADIQLIETHLANSSQRLSGLPAELNKLRLHHRKTLHNLPIGVCSLGSDGEILMWNQAMENFTGISAAVTSGALVSALPQPWATLFTDFSQSDDVHRYAVKVLQGNNKMWCNFHKAAIEADSPDFLGNQVLLLEDITETLLLTQELVHTERLASVGRLAAGVAHEIGNPVTGIACLAQDIRACDPDPETREATGLILEQTDRITRIVRSLTRFSRGGGEDLVDATKLPIRKPVEDALQLLALQRDDKQLQYHNQVPDSLQVQGDSHQLTQVFLNLLTNARDASPDLGIIEIHASIADQSVVIEVTDQGKGIPEHVLEKIYEPFFTTKDAGDGTGLGLSLVYNIINHHRGSIEILNLNPGVMVRIELPLATQ